MFRRTSDIELLVDRLVARDVSLWHACQLRDYEAYLEIGGIPSRSLMEHAHVAFTPFVTDATDRSGGVWSKVFANLNDFGAAFAHGAEAVPNPYGPIVFQIRPTVLARASDVAITLRSAGGHDFDREKESLDSLEELEHVFRNPPNAPFPERSFLRYGDELRTVFAPKYENAASTEVSLSIDPELIPLSEVVVIWVDPIAPLTTSLFDSVTGSAERLGHDLRVKPRHVYAERRAILDDVVKFLTDAPSRPSLRSLAGRGDLEQSTRDWASTLLRRDLDWQFTRFATYLMDGTLGLLDSSAGAREREARPLRVSSGRH